MENLKTLLKRSEKDVKGRIVDNHVILNIVEADAHYWSPQLDFRVEENRLNKEHSVLKGLIGPRPEVWTMFMFIYFSTGIIGFFISSYGVAKMLIGEYSNWILAFPIAVLFMLTAYRAGKYGEQLADDQIETLKQFVREAISFEK